MLQWILSPEDILLLHTITMWTWWVGLATAISYMFKRTQKVAIFEIRPDGGGTELNLHAHAGISLAQESRNYELSICLKLNFSTNYSRVSLNLSHPIVGMIIAGLSAYYSMILPFILSLLLMGQELKYIINLDWVLIQLKNQTINIANQNLFARWVVPNPVISTTPAAAAA